MADKEILKKLDHIQADLNYIKDHMIDADIVLSEEDIAALAAVDTEYADGKTKRL